MVQVSLLEALKNSSIFGVAIYVTENGILDFVNKKAAEILDYEQNELIGKSMFDLILEKANLEKAKNIVRRRIRGDFFHEEFRDILLLSKSGASVPARIFSYTIKYKQGYAGFLLLYDRTKEKSIQKLFLSLSQINQLITKAENEETLLTRVCSILVNDAGYAAATIGIVNAKTGMFDIKHLKAASKDMEEDIINSKIGVDKSKPYGRGSVSIAYSTGKISIIKDISSNPLMEYWQEINKKYNSYSACSIPIFKNNKIAYILLLHDKFKSAFGEEQIRLLDEIQVNLSYALTNMENRKTLTLLFKAISTSHEWVVITDKKGKITYVNKAVSDISGYSKKELIGQNPNVLKSGVHSKDFYSKLWSTILKGESFKERFINKTKDGRLFYLDALIIPILQDGEIHRFVDLSRDVTEIVKHQKDIELQSRIYETLFELTNLSIQSKKQEDFFKKLPEIFVKYTGMEIAYIALRTEKQAYISDYYIKDERFVNPIESIKEHIIKRSMERPSTLLLPEKSIKYKKVYMVNDISKKAEKLDMHPFDYYAKLHNIHACCSVPLVKKDKAMGFLALASTQKNIFGVESYRLFNAVSKQIEFILNKFEEDMFSRIIQTALNTGFEFIVITDKNFKIVYANKKTLETSGYSEKEVIGQHHSIFSSKTHSKDFSKRFYELLHSGSIYAGIMKYRAKNGHIFNFYTTIIPFRGDGAVSHYISIGKHIDSEDKLKDELNKLLHYDSVTGLLNLKYFREAINNSTKTSIREDRIGAVAVINPMSFKSINQAWGFERGNAILKAIGERLTETLRNYDIVAKLESDRFGILIKDIMKEDYILFVVQKIMNKLTKSYKIDNHNISLSFNMGLSLFPEEGTDADELIRKAQIALFDAKEKGENRIGFFKEDLESSIIDRLNLKAELELAVKNREFVAYYQPYVDKNEKICGAESLIRWQKDRKIVPPMRFIPYMEEIDLITGAERLMLKMAAETISNLKATNKNPIPISVNLSYKSLKQEGLIKDIALMLAKYNIEGSLLKIEILERTFLKNFEYIKNIMNKLKKYGVTFSLDDFGTGYSSLSYLSELPVNYLKIDISFVRKIVTDDHTRNIVESIIYIAKKLGIKTIAEGVEKREQFTLLKKMGCEYFQGFLFYKPMSEKKFKALMDKNG